MANMSYCRFQNTLQDLRDCEMHMGDDELSPDEQDAKESIIALCERIAGTYGDSNE